MKNTNKSFLTVLLASFCCLASFASQAADREPPMISGYYGSGSVIFFYGTEAIWTPGCECEWLTRYGLDPRWAVNVAYWKGHDEHPSSLWNAGAHGLLRWAPLKSNAVSPFIELGTGIQLVSKTTINTNRFLGGAFQFGSRVGAGVAWGTERRYELLTFLEHVSNADISHPNDGATYIALQFRVGL
jgi:lipid A 3-O-deacylase PagL